MTAPGAPVTLAATVREFLRYPSPRILLVLAAGFTAARASSGGGSFWDLVVMAGLLAFWPLQEWLIHVFVLHFRPRTIGGRTFDLVVAQKHRAHHQDPARTELIFIPLRVYVLVPLQVAFWLLLFPSPLGLTGLAFNYILSLHYEWTHFMVHSRYQPRTRFYRRLWRNHRLHHFKNERHWYGVTALSGDHLFGTSGDPATVPLSPTCRTII